MCFTGSLEQVLLGADAMFQMPYCGEEIQASGLIGCIANKMKNCENSVTEGFNGEHFSNFMKKSNP